MKGPGSPSLSFQGPLYDDLTCCQSLSEGILLLKGATITYEEGDLRFSLYTVGIRCIQPPEFFPLTSIVNKLCNIEGCVNNTLQIIQNMMFSQGLELELSMFRRTATHISSQLPLFNNIVKKFAGVFNPCSHYISMGAGVEYFCNFF